MRTAGDRNYDAIKVENRLFDKLRATECSGADALSIADFLLKRLKLRKLEGSDEGTE